MTLNTHLFATKLAPPRIGARIVLRRQLLDRLRLLRQRRLVLVTGSAGFGKTILLAQWRQQLLKDGYDVAWLSLSPDERLLPAFRAYLLVAAQELGLAPHGVEAMLDESEAANDAVIRALINEARNASRELYLIIDDFHHVEDPRAHQLIQRLLDVGADNVHWIIAARATPALRLSRMRVMEQLGEIECTELPFDFYESVSFLERNLARKLSTDEARLIHDVTEGWPATLQLVTIALNGRSPHAVDLRKLVLQARDLRNYLAEDVLTQLPPELVAFMEPLSVFRRFCAPLARHVTGRVDAAEAIEEIERANLFVFPVDQDDSEPWFRFHPLFADVLGERLARRGAEAVARIHERACRWFAEKDLLPEVLRHASLSGRPYSVIALVERLALEQTRLSHLGPLARWLEQIPARLQAPHPLLPVLGALAHALTGGTEKACDILARLPHDTISVTPALAARVDLVRAIVKTQRDETADLVECVARIPETLLTERMTRQTRLTAMLLGLVARGRFEQARQMFATHPVAQHERSDEMMLIAETVLLMAHWYSGDCAATIRCGDELLARAEAAHGRRSISASICAALLSAAHYETNRIDEARELLANRMDMLRRSTPETAIQATLCEARLDALQGERGHAMEFLKSQHAHFADAGFSRATAAVLALRVELELQIRNVAGAIAARDALATHVRRQVPTSSSECETLAIEARARASVSLAERRYDEALASLAAAREWYERFRREGRLVDCDLLAARIHDARGDTDAARSSLRRALIAGARLSMLRTFIDHGPALLRQIDDPSLTRDLPEAVAALTKRIIAVARSGVGSSAGPHNETNSPDDVRLTPRELQVLSMLDQSMSTKRIALTLNLSPNTVKWNVKNIFGKLGVNSRYAALALARQRKLLEG